MANQQAQLPYVGLVALDIKGAMTELASENYVSKDIANLISESNDTDEHRFDNVDDVAEGAGKLTDDVVKNSNMHMPATRVELHQNLLNKGYRCNGTSEGGYVTYMHPDGRRVDIRPNGEVISTQKSWLPDGSRKITERFYYDGTKVPNGGHNTGEFVEPIEQDTFLPPKP